MKPQTVGRVLGVGLRVAGRMAGQRLAGSEGHRDKGTEGHRDPSASLRAGSGTEPAVLRNAGQRAGKATVNVGRGVGGFLRPFGRVGGILMLEVTGAFFAIFVLVFGQMVWRMRSNYAHGPDHPKFLMAVGLSLVFLYLSVSSFWRARRR